MGETAKSRSVIFYIRHGETDWNVTGRLQGRRDVPLNARGRAQAMHRGEILRELFARDGRSVSEGLRVKPTWSRPHDDGAGPRATRASRGRLSHRATARGDRVWRVGGIHDRSAAFARSAAH